MGCEPCVAPLTSPAERLAALRNTLAAEHEPVATVTHLLRLCRDDHAVLWEHMNDAVVQDDVRRCIHPLADRLSTAPRASTLDSDLRARLVNALECADNVPPVAIAHALAQLLDDRFAHAFADFFQARSPYQPAVGDPVPLNFPNLRQLTSMPFTSPPWRLANRLDQTRHIRLAGEWAVQFRVVFDYSLATNTQLIDSDTVIATCHPNRTLDELALPRDVRGRSFPVRPRHRERQRATVNQLIATATEAGADMIVLPELCLTEELAYDVQDWVRRSTGPRLLVAGSFHHEAHRDQEGPSPTRRRNTSLMWFRGHDQPLVHDKHSPADAPVNEDIQPQGWPELRVHVIDSWHVVVEVCRDILNPQAVHALTEIGANLVLVPAMSQTLLAFGGQAANLVGSCQALVAVANNPGEWRSADEQPVRPARALFGHPGLDDQTIAVHSPEPGPGIALLSVRSAEVAWLPI